MKYAICNFDFKNGTVQANDGSLSWHEGELGEAMGKVKESERQVCALFLPSDVPLRGVPVNADVDREMFEKYPGIYGVCFYKGWRGYVFE